MPCRKKGIVDLCLSSVLDFYIMILFHHPAYLCPRLGICSNVIRTGDDLIKSQGAVVDDEVPLFVRSRR
jgi:hypothetical protein